MLMPSKGNTEPINLTERKKATDHCKANDEQKRRLEKQLAVHNCQKAVNQTEEDAPMLWLALKPIQARHMVVSLVMTGETSLILIFKAGSRGVSLDPRMCRQDA